MLKRCPDEGEDGVGADEEFEAEEEESIFG